jgi:hypothetical protein
MKTILLMSSFLILGNAMAEWTNPYACDPKNTKECWITCFNSGSFNGDPMIRVYITPAKNEKAEFIIQKEGLFSGKMKTYSEGKVIRNDIDSLNINLPLGNSSLKVSTTEDRILENNGWSLSGMSVLAGKNRKMICSYISKPFLINYVMRYTPGFPLDLFNRFYESDQ